MKIEYFNHLFVLLHKCIGLKQDPDWHPEGDVWNHSVQCFNLAIDETDDVDLILSALFHDIGKTMGGHGHEQHSVEICLNYLSNKSLWLIENHMKINYLLEGIMKRTSKIKELKENQWYLDLLNLNNYDKCGRLKNYHYESDFFKSKRFQKFIELLERYKPISHKCSWCKPNHFIGNDFGFNVSHGMCPKASKIVNDELDLREGQIRKKNNYSY